MRTAAAHVPGSAGVALLASIRGAQPIIAGRDWIDPT
jgi:hypothetical protein